MNRGENMSKSWFNRASSFWVRYPASLEGWAVVILAFAFWLVVGVVLQVFNNPTLLGVLSFILAGIFLYLVVVWIAHNTDDSVWTTFHDE